MCVRRLKLELLIITTYNLILFLLGQVEIYLNKHYFEERFLFLSIKLNICNNHERISKYSVLKNSESIPLQLNFVKSLSCSVFIQAT